MDNRTEAHIRAAAENGWDFFKQILSGPQSQAAQVSAEQMQRAEQLAYDLADWYGTDAGKRVIDFLDDITLNRATFVAHLGLAMDQAYGHGILREGQNAIVFTLLKMIAEGRKERPPTERTATHEDQSVAIAAAESARRRRQRRRKR